jgi:hypothetical protein
MGWYFFDVGSWIRMEDAPRRPALKRRLSNNGLGGMLPSAAPEALI